MLLRALRRLRRRDDGSLPLAMMLTLVGTSLSTLMVPIAITQLRDTAETIDRAKALHAAQAGIDVIVGSIRASAGTLANVLCLPAADPLLGVVGGGLPGRYQVSIQFQDATTTNINDCKTRASILRTVPTYAVITSTGTTKESPTGQLTAIPKNDPAARTLTATYVFRFTNENVEGGLVKFYGGAYCLDAGSGSPAVGTNVSTQPCSAGSSRQMFAYTKQLALQLVSSKTAANPQGMCLDSGASPVSGSLVQFQVCGSPTFPYNQRWNINDSSNFQSTASNGTSLGSLCFHAKSGSTPGAFVELSSCGGAADNTRTFAPEASVGAGAAGAPYQLVNFKQFGRCIDVTNFDTTIGFLIVWPCKQAPNPLNVGWNQRFSIPSNGTLLGYAEGRISTYDSTKTYKTYCLTTADPYPAAQHFVTVKECPTTDDNNVKWTVYYDMGQGSYGTSYVIKDYKGNCLTPADLDDAKLPAGDVFKGSTTVSKLTMAVCNASKLQKWNAPPNADDPSPLKNIGEN
ncbi:ricin-type beta-trefoil lectin domain protein [Dactylosporangium salmoneum]|uniref:Ricin B lectin domain-containing protein n=1 Tax=Dactylosporangium salmoneum TaxID=53361 RepID=A0ABN3FBW2_9ACTN